eukprot:TRINITY_DN707_c0_g1_i1.p1 TRINITY_DN707_c0_g1~~TRINITY_DN707_c0_g1_i1.p1  ORF type:complete len:615 (-),score=155.75 TRINITY_DN707_c0_g1_i1:193-2037(-)
MDSHGFGDGKDTLFNSSLSGSASHTCAANGTSAAARTIYQKNESSSGGFDLNVEDFLSHYDYPKMQSLSDSSHVIPSRPGNTQQDSYMGGSHSDRFTESKTLRSFAGDQLLDDDRYLKEIVTTVELTMKKYADDLFKVLEGMSNRLAQLELVTQKLERSVGELKADVANNQSEQAERFRFLENHVREVHRAVQILRDKQEIAEAQTELVKLQLGRKDSSNLHGSEEKTRSSSSLSDEKDHAFQQGSTSQQRPLLPALPAPPTPQQTPASNITTPSPNQCQPLPQQQSPPHGKVMQHPSSTSTLQQATQEHQLPNQMPMQPYYQQASQLQGPFQQIPQTSHLSQMPHSQQSSQSQPAPPPQAQQIPYMNQPSHLHHISSQSGQPPVPRSSAHMPQQSPMHHQPPQQLQVQPNQLRSNVYPGQPLSVGSEGYTYNSEHSNQQNQMLYQAPPEYNYGNTTPQPSATQGPLAVQAPRPQLSQGGSLSSEGGIASSQSLLPPVHPMHGYTGYSMSPRPHPNKYASPIPPVSQTNSFPGAYARYPSQQSHSYPHSSDGNMASGRGYEDVVEQVAGMGFPRDEVRAVIQHVIESGQPVDLNLVLDRLNSGAAGPKQRGWYN